MRWPTAFLLSVLAVSLAAACFAFAGCAKSNYQKHLACVEAHSGTSVILTPKETGTGTYEIVQPAC